MTHEHSDHTIGLTTLTKRYHVPIVADPRTFTAIQENILSSTKAGRPQGSSIHVGDVGETLAVSLSSALHVGDVEETPAVSLPNASSDPLETLAFPVGTQSSIGDIEITSFPISHDAIAPCGYLLRAGGCRVCIVTDSGEVTSVMLDAMQYADLLILESNHDRERLIRGPYPQHLKKRILSPTGHLSNDQAADAVLRTWRPDGVRWLWLAHISKTNNTQTLALNSMRSRLQAANVNLSHIHISVSPPNMGRVWDSTQLWHSESLWEMSR